jgi:hypothetical protein
MTPAPFPFLSGFYRRFFKEKMARKGLRRKQNALA